MKQYKIAVAGTGYVGMSIAVLLAQHNRVTAVDVLPEKVEKINRRQSPIQDEYIENTSPKSRSTLRQRSTVLRPTATPTSWSSPPPRTTTP